mgnify:CR=1 FL=1
MDSFIHDLLMRHDSVVSIEWESGGIVQIHRKSYPSFRAAILREIRVTPEHIEPYLDTSVSVISNFPKIGKWTGAAINLCETNSFAWGQWSLMMRAINNESPETTQNPEIAFNRRALAQHSRVLNVEFEFDHLLLVTHDRGVVLKVAMLYQYDLTGDDVRDAWDEFGKFDVLLKTNPNGSILDGAREVANSLGTKVFGIRDTLSYLARGKF